DYYERAMWNHILASLNPENGRVCYFVSLEPGGHKQYLGLHDFTCCNGTGMENHGSYNDNIYFHGRDELWVNQFVASELHWAEKGLRLRQETVFPKAGRSRIAILADKPLRLALHVRHPAWASNGFAVKLNGQTVDARFQPQTYVTVEREWQTGDVVEVELPMNLRTEAMPDNPARQAVFAGPILLAGDMGPVGSTNAVPAFVTEEPLSKSLAAADGEALNFRSWNIGKPRDAILKPFYELHDRRQAVYWDVFSAEQWQRQQLQHAAVQAAQQALEARTIDWFQPGEMQPERDHNVQGERSDAGEYSGRKLRHAVDGGWFSFDMKVDAAGTNELICTWWGSETGNRMFDILVDGQKLATQRLQNDRPGEFWEATYRIPLGYTEGKTKVSIRLQAHPGNFAGGLFGARMVRPNGGT
ncbi:MAG TPA: DUF6805 domain-containing protein, partial [Verrucomicrobiae bacterium]|nr:DUF6805 domain-containing protein [Verrucomicrobiae bacterium]